MKTTATATQGIFGYTGSLGSTISARSRREPKYSKQKQTRMIHAILSRRMMSPPSYEDVLDYVDSNVTYAENKREVLAVFGERSRKGRMITDKDMKDMYCDSLHNQCVSNGLETCQTACAECKTPAACDKAKQIKKEIKKHGRKLTHLERLQIEHAEEAKRASMKAKYSTGDIIRCREGYEMQCGFSGARKITQVKQYPDYVMYAIKGKEHGFVEEDWITGVKVEKVKVKQKVVRRAKKVKKVKPAKVVKTKRVKKVKAQKAKTVKPCKISKKVKTVKVSKPGLHTKILSKNQRALLRIYKFLDVSILGKRVHVTPQYAKRGKIVWNRINGKICLKRG